jgi:hypothetical protein
MANQTISSNHNAINEKLADQNRSCVDPIVGAILSGWRYDISSISPEMRTDYENHLGECGHCRRRQYNARFFDVLLITVSSLSIIAFLLAAVVVHRLEFLNQITDTHILHLHTRAVVVSMEAVAIAGAVISTLLWVLVAIATPLPGLVTSLVEQRIPSDLRQRFARRHV